MLPFAPNEDGKNRRYAVLEMSWSEWFLWMEALGPVLSWSTNGWGMHSREEVFSGWSRVPGGDVWVNTSDGSELNTAMMETILAVEEISDQGFCLSCQVLHQNGHGHLKIVLSHESDLDVFYTMVAANAVETPAPQGIDFTPPDPVAMPPVKDLRAQWFSAARLMPTETFGGWAPLARLAVLNHIGEDYAKILPTSLFALFLKQLTKYHCPINLSLHHPDHTLSKRLVGAKLKECGCFWHLLTKENHSHFPKSKDLEIWMVRNDPTRPECADIEIYHRPSRRLLAWIHSDANPLHAMHWRKALQELN